MQVYDVIIVGGGMLGLSTAYHLARMGASTLLLEAGTIGGGTSAGCTGRAQVNEGHLDHLNTTLIREGYKRFEGLEEELGLPFEWHYKGFLNLIRTKKLLDEWVERAGILNGVGIATEILDVKSIQEAEPRLNTDGILGAAYSTEGLLNPLLFSWAYARAAQNHGARVLHHQKVTGILKDGRRVHAVETQSDRFYCDRLAVMCGAWTPVVTRLAGIEVPIRHTHAEAFVTEPVPPMIHNTIEFADFYETIHGKQKAVAIGLSPEPKGTLLVTEAVKKTDELHDRVSAWGLAAMASELIRILPALGDVRMVRSWGRPTSFTPDEEPLIGWLPEVENMYTASSMMETITTVPLISEWMALSILGNNPPISLDPFSPARFVGREITWD